MTSLRNHPPRVMRLARGLAGVLFFVGLSSCLEEDVVWEQFNQDDQLQVSVTASAELGAPVSAALHSTTGAVVVGEVTVDPGSGPVGTLHTVSVAVLEDWVDVVSKVTLLTDAGERGVQETELWQDSADHGLWVRSVQSEGAVGESRTDTFTVQLWAEAADVAAVEE
ncbi:MAG: hypothetical protein JXX28_08625 [Deltaproteobacteria bacterium]|nr:hypothetical protein [Deltaproteobacteria bacterium]